MFQPATYNQICWYPILLPSWQDLAYRGFRNVMCFQFIMSPNHDVTSASCVAFHGAMFCHDIHNKLLAAHFVL